LEVIVGKTSDGRRKMRQEGRTTPGNELVTVVSNELLSN
jgi:hypothetical protein